ncbi:MAG TPA: hypothetical protein VF125_08370 [Solirubrobacterales bacterium]
MSVDRRVLRKRGVLVGPSGEEKGRADDATKRRLTRIMRLRRPPS